MAVKKNQIPKYGFKVKLNHVYPEKWSQNMCPRWNQLWDLISLAIRYLVYSVCAWCNGKRPVMDYINGLNGRQIYGVPIGGIGSGSIGRGFKGEFCRYQLRPGNYQYEVIPGNQFILTVKKQDGETIYQKVLNCAGAPKGILKSWKWDFPGENADYVGLYPRSWTTFNIPEQKLKLTCRQISPIIPHNYKDSSLPGAVFIWNVENNGDEPRIISITFTYTNAVGEKSDRKKGCKSQVFHDKGDAGFFSGILINQFIGTIDYTSGVSSRPKDGMTVTCLRQWNPLGDGKDVWKQLEDKGHFPPCNTNVSSDTRDGQLLGVAVCCQTTIPEKSDVDYEFCLVWDLPKINFGQSQITYVKHYTRFFGKEWNIARLSAYCYQHYPFWEEEIEKWQSPILEDPKLPDWYKSALFNETYFVSDGGTVWLQLSSEEMEKLDPDDPRREFGRFAYLEGHEYRMYNTYDVHFYASFALSMLWPKLQAVIQRDFCDAITKEDKSQQWHLYNGTLGIRKVKNSIPHDLGDPWDEPFININAYPIHDVSEWRDLDIKFVLQAYRDYKMNKDLEQLKYLWKNICLLMQGALRWDKDGDGLIENQGVPDQTYDTWTMTGPSSYCGGLWLAALQCTCEMASILSDESTQNRFSKILQEAKTAFQDKLWNGQYYNFDCSSNSKSITIMSDQLCGVWYLKCCGTENKILPEPDVMSSLKMIYNFNVMKFKGGTMGAVNGMKPNGKVDYCTIQSEEVWVGVVYALASLMIHQGMVDEAFKTASGIYETVYNRIGMGFETPEALYGDKKYRAIGYMRPLSIWSIQLAWEMSQKQTSKEKTVEEGN